MVNLNWQPGMTLEAIEKEAILQAIRFYRGNKTATANALGFAIRTLDAKLEKYKQDDDARKQAQDERLKREQDFVNRSRFGNDGKGGNPIRNPAQRRNSEENVDDGTKASSELGMESSSEVPSQQRVPLSERQKVQGVSSSNAPARGQARRG